MVHQAWPLAAVLDVHNNRDILRVKTMISVVLAVCLLILIKNYFSSNKKMMRFGLAGFLLVRRAFSTAAQVASFTDLLL
jgi:hypothetical protein